MAAARPPDIFSEAERYYRALNGRRVDFVLVGGVAVNLWGIPTDTGDIDTVILLHRPDDLERAFGAARTLGYSAVALKMKDGRFFSVPRDFRRWSEFQALAAPPPAVAFVRLRSGRAPYPIDLNLVLTGVTPEKVWQNSLPAGLGKTRVRVISFEDLVRNKRAIVQDPSSDDAERLKAQRHLQLLDLAVRAGRGGRLTEGFSGRRYRKVQGRMRLVEVTRVRGKERIRLIV